MGMQISRGVYPEVSSQGGVWTTASPSGRGVPGVSPAAREGDRGGASAIRSRASVAQYSAQVGGGTGGGVSQREECDSHCPDVWGPRAEFRGGALLGTRLLGLDGWAE